MKARYLYTFKLILANGDTFIISHIASNQALAEVMIQSILSHIAQDTTDSFELISKVRMK